MNITIWNEFRHEQESEDVQAVYPNGIHHVIASFLTDDHIVTTATLDEPQHGLTDDVLAQTDVLIWWGHKVHEEVDEEVVEKVKQKVLEGMGLVVLHSGHFSKIFKSLMGTSCDLKWREADEKERLWVVDPTHPIAEGIDSYFELEKEEMYGEHFDIPSPDETVFISWFEGGEVFRSGATFKRGNGKIFYFRPGHETYPTYYNVNVQKVIKNAVKWAFNSNTTRHQYGNVQPLEQISKK
ncbi:ThuA domain-containing protein [Staphylococcus pseudoxylosus]|uniref:ThuA domain-containing protein n=1 Tax=Staphylococcus pseudoxylosus TaxID=2282419 RepID=UPI000D1D54E7|nr:ThuA domain-containing protein [Staphylococcus pseudoxylosus]PTI46466.1 trehalose utilization protein ThuA [Staphylococcus xylosus]MEB6037297.1 ThuA domain-containing protein [Staphylococcus pseudoxylosus]MEB6045631.1 ThuA domain-containing protein [Staphylococcus pseudoxylosus]MEB6061739.1 ThuA domain-containing protein [Staphylococcus pseudoxylosus]MEB7753497.1 ThuA domain-containing protein [Staphylococcus pseudoxylosus]